MKIINNKFFAISLIAGMVLIAYFNTFGSPFIFDDSLAIESNDSIKQASLLPALTGTRPVVSLCNWLNFHFCGLSVAGWHLFNISLHIVNSYLVYLLILWTLDLRSLIFRRESKIVALFGALLFALHPIQTEAVTYIVSRTELIATFFYLSTVLLFSRKAYIPAFFTACLAMGSKEWAVTLPVMVVIYDYLFMARGDLRQIYERRMAYMLLGVSWLILAYLIGVNGLNGAGPAAVARQNPELTSRAYLFTSVNVLWTGIRLLIFPINQNLDYSYPITKTFPIIAFMGHLSVIGSAIWLWVKKGWTLILFGVLFFYIAFSPVQSIIPILDIFFEHRLYLPSIGFFMVIVGVIEKSFERK